MRKPPSRPDRWLLAMSTVIFLVTCVVALRTLLARSETSDSPSSTVIPQADVSSTLVANLTQIPQSAPLTGQLASDVDEIEVLMNACADYTEERRSQSQQHIAWLREPSTLPEQMIIALGGAPTAGLLRGLATYTLSDWGLVDQNADSCLRPIGQKINALLVAEGGESVEAFEDIAE